MVNKYPNILAVIGSQWGDEGKGKITDYFAQKADAVIRWSGGDNAGHTIVINQKKYKLSIVPSGIFNSHSLNIIANGCVINLVKLVEEIEYLQQNNFNCNKLRISNRAHLILPYHHLLDELQEQHRVEPIGTTKKGIGPCYQDKAERIGIRIGDLFNPDRFYQLLSQNIQFKNLILTKIYNISPLNCDEIFQKYLTLFSKIKPFVVDSSLLINQLIKQNKKILFEGAQGVMLDLDHGTYPFVTSSNPSAASIPIGAGIAPWYLTNILGIVKAYSTRVGAGSFPSEINAPLADIIREKGHEYGTVSGRARRIGWFDSVLLQHSVRISGYTSLAITLLDVLSEIEEIKICTSYTLNGKKITYVPDTIEEYDKCQANFITLPGWKKDISNITTYEELPNEAKNYLKTIERLVQVPIALFSVGPDRQQTILLQKGSFYD